MLKPLNHCYLNSRKPGSRGAFGSQYGRQIEKNWSIPFYGDTTLILWQDHSVEVVR